MRFLVLFLLMTAPAWATQDYNPPPARSAPAPVMNTANGGTAAATAGAKARAIGQGGAAQATNAGVSVSNNTNSAPYIGLPSIGGGGFDCPTVGLVLGASAIGGGGGLGPSWISPACDRRKKAELLLRMGQDEAALELMRQDPEVADALRAVSERKVTPVVYPAASPVRPEYCEKAPPHERKHYPQCQ